MLCGCLGVALISMWLRHRVARWPRNERKIPFDGTHSPVFCTTLCVQAFPSDTGHTFKFSTWVYALLRQIRAVHVRTCQHMGGYRARRDGALLRFCRAYSKDLVGNILININPLQHSGYYSFRSCIYRLATASCHAARVPLRSCTSSSSVPG